jgi:hypothetical protein
MIPRTILDHVSASIIPIDNETHAMLDYAESTEAQAKFEQPWRELREGKGIIPTPEYFADLNRRISERVRNASPDNKAGTYRPRSSFDQEVEAIGVGIKSLLNAVPHHHFSEIEVEAYFRT